MELPNSDILFDDFYYSPTILITLAFSLIILLSWIFYLLTLQNTFNKISVENRRMPSGQVWLSLIPLFGFIWQIIIVIRLADSLRAEFEKRGITVGEARPGYNLGLTYSILFCAGIIPILGTLASLGGLVCWIIYWTKIYGYKKKLQE